MEIIQMSRETLEAIRAPKTVTAVYNMSAVSQFKSRYRPWFTASGWTDRQLVATGCGVLVHQSTLWDITLSAVKIAGVDWVNPTPVGFDSFKDFDEACDLARTFTELLRADREGN